MALTKIDDRGLTTPIDLLDNEKIRFGTGNDLEIYHDGSNNLITSSTANTWIKNTAEQGFANGSEYEVRCYANAQVELYYDNSKKFETTSAGAQLTGSLAFMSESTNIAILDNGKAKFGNGDDLQIYHDGTNSFLKNNTNAFTISTETANAALYLKSDALRLWNSAGNEQYIVADKDGAVEIYYDNSKKLDTNSGGVKIHGNLDVDDNNKLRVGTSSDLQIFHDGSHSFIDDTGTGSLIVRSSDFLIRSPASAEAIADFHQNGAVELFYDNSKKFETTASGVSISGNAVLDDGTNARITLQAEDTNTNQILSTTTNFGSYCEIKYRGTDHIFQYGTTELLRIASGGDVGIGNNSPSCKLAITDLAEHTAYASATPSVTDSMLQLYNNPPNETANDHATMQFGVNGGSHNRVASISAVAESAGNRKLALAFCTDEAGSRTEKLRITGDGNVGIGDSSPASYANYTTLTVGADATGSIIELRGADANFEHLIQNNNGDLLFEADLNDVKANTSIIFKSDSTQKLKIDKDGDIEISDGNLKVASGHGIDFSSTSGTGTSELLDDYEEGTWTPTIHFSSGGNTATYTSTTGGWYVKVGRLVTCNGRISLSAKGSGSSAVYFAGLPFTVGDHNSGSSGVEGGLTISYLSNVNADKGSGIIGGYANEGTTQAIPFYVDTSGDFHYVEDFDLENSANIGFTITYCV